MHGRFLSVALALLMVFSSFTAEAAKRMGSGKSFGKQSNNVSQTQGAKPAQNAAPATPATPAGAAPQRRPWGAMLGDLDRTDLLVILQHPVSLHWHFTNTFICA